MVKIIFMISIVAKPLIALSPKVNKIIATIMVVTLASIILLSDSLLPIMNALGRGRPFFSSSFTLSKLIIEVSTAIPIPSNIAAMPGSVSTPPIRLYIKNEANV